MKIKATTRRGRIFEFAEANELHSFGLIRVPKFVILASPLDATSVSLFPRPRIRDITSDRLALVNTSGIQGFTVISGQRETPFHFIRFMRVHPVVKPAPLRVAWI